MSRAIPPLPQYALMRGAWLSTGITLPFFLLLSATYPNHGAFRN
jgi:hypothetical protein